MLEQDRVRLRVRAVERVLHQRNGWTITAAHFIEDSGDRRLGLSGLLDIATDILQHLCLHAVARAEQEGGRQDYRWFASHYYLPWWVVVDLQPICAGGLGPSFNLKTIPSRSAHI